MPARPLLLPPLAAAAFAAAFAWAAPAARAQQPDAADPPAAEREDPAPPGAEPEAAGPETLELTLAQAIERAVRNNTSMVTSRLNRTLQRFDLEDAETMFEPKLNFGTIQTGHSVDRRADTSSTRLSVGPGMDMRLPWGGSVGVGPSWSATVSRNGERAHSDSAALSLSLRQPLLRGAGLETGRAPLELARIAEEGNVLSFRATAMDTITTTIQAYRAVVQAELRAEIDERSLRRARETLEINRLLIDTGRMAEQDITQTEANIARRELALIRGRDALDDARRNLNVLLDLDGDIRVVPIEPLDIEPAPPPDLAVARALARQFNTAYLGALLSVRRADIGYALAENGALWDLSLTADASYDGTGGSWGSAPGDLAGDFDKGRYAIGLALTVPLGGDAGKATERSLLSARISRMQAAYGLASAERGMETRVRNAVRAVEAGLQEIAFAREALALAERKLEIEQEKLTLGLSSNYRLTDAQDDLVDAQVSELNARIGYLNALAALDRIQGTVLDTWGVDIESGVE